MLNMHNIASASFYTNENELIVKIPSGQTDVFIEIFDGDVAGTFQNGGQWDGYSSGAFSEVTYSIYTKNNAFLNEVFSQNMLDNDWSTIINVPNEPSAFDSNEDAYIYKILAKYDILETINTNGLKFRANGSFDQSYENTFGIIGYDQGILDLLNTTGSSSYVGDVTYKIELDETNCSIDIYDGDFDRGNDSDDINTGSPNSFFPFSVGDNVFNEAANAGDPLDDSPLALARIEPNVLYFVSGTGYAVTNNDPSGTSEWELFRIASESQDCIDAGLDPSNPNYDPDGSSGSSPAAIPDVVVPELKAGTHHVVVKGLDNVNLVFIKSEQEIGSAKPRQHCAGQMTWLVLEYTGTIQDAHIVVTQGTGGNSIDVFDAIVQPGEFFTFAGQKASGTFGSKINITVDGQHNVEIVTTCSNNAEALLGESFGDFIIRDGASLNGGLLL